MAEERVVEAVSLTPARLVFVSGLRECEIELPHRNWVFTAPFSAVVVHYLGGQEMSVGFN